MPEKPSCLFIGRFQPFHNGHLLVIQGMSKVCGKIIIAIGSSDKSGTAENPFTAAERRDMIQRSLQGVDIIPIHDVAFIEVPDMPGDEAWANTVLELAAVPIDKVWTGNEDTKRIFTSAGKEVQWIKEVPGISATEVRKRIQTNGKWELVVPREVVTVIDEVQGVERLKKLS